MTLDEIFAEIAQDFHIDPLDLAGESLKSSDLFVKYIRLYSESKLRVELLLNQQKNILANRRKYYSGDAEPSVYKENPFGLKIKTEAVMRQYLDTDPEIVKANEKILIEQQKQEIYYGCLGEIKSRSYSIKSAIDMRKFEAGM